MNGKSLLDISWNTILKVILTSFVVYLLFLTKDVLILIIFSLIISILFNPAIVFLQKRKIPYVLATFIVYFFIFGCLAILIYFISASFIPEVRQFAGLLPQYFDKITPPLKGLGIEVLENFDSFIKISEEWLLGASANIFNALFIFFGGAINAFLVIILAFFFSLEEDWIEKAIKFLFPKKQEDLALSVWKNSRRKIVGWFAARLVCCIFVGVASFVALKLFRVDYAATLGVFAGITNIIPYFGPIIAGALITVLVFIDDWLKAVFIIITFILIQQIEGNILNPVLVKKFIGLPPALVLISLIIGGKIWGLLGMILIVPFVGILFEFIRDFFKKNKEKYDSLPEEEES